MTARQALRSGMVLDRPFPAAGRQALLDAAERSDPFGHTLHMAAALAWCFAHPVANAPEAIAWGFLFAIALARVPMIWRVYAAALRDPLWIALAVWALALSVSVAWTPEPVRGLRQAMPERSILTPLMLWPVAGRIGALLCAMAAGCLLQCGSLLLMSRSGDGWLLYTRLRAISPWSPLQWIVHLSACVFALGAWRLRGRTRATAVVGLLASLACIVPMASRMLSVAAVLSLTVFVWRVPRSAVARASALVAVLVLASTAVIVLTPAGDRMQKSVAALPADATPGSRLAALTGLRSALFEVGFAMGSEHWLRGCGRRSFTVLLPEVSNRLAEEASNPADAQRFRTLSTSGLNDSHNLVLSAWIEGGVVAAAAISVAVFGLGVRLWRQSVADPLGVFAMMAYVTVLVGVFTGIVTTRAGMATLGLCFVVSWRQQGARTAVPA